MNRRNKVIFATILVAIFILHFKYDLKNVHKYLGNVQFSVTESSIRNNEVSGEKMVIVVPACDVRWREVFVILKSTLLFTSGILQFHIFYHPTYKYEIEIELLRWKKQIKFNFKMHKAVIPSGKFGCFKEKFSPCDIQKITVSTTLKNVDSVLYLEPNSLVLGSVEQIWSQFKQMNSSQFVAVASEAENSDTEWYPKFAKHPYYQPYGINTGVMLMNLTRIREFNWDNQFISIFNKYKENIPWGEQDIFNIFFHNNSDKVYLLSCKYNYRSKHCLQPNGCDAAEKEGVIVLHPSYFLLHDFKFPFKSIHHAVIHFPWYGDLYTDFYKIMEQYLESSNASYCRHAFPFFKQNVRKFFIDK